VRRFNRSNPYYNIDSIENNTITRNIRKVKSQDEVLLLQWLIFCFRFIHTQKIDTKGSG
jgi:hypothetical protein